MVVFACFSNPPLSHLPNTYIVTYAAVIFGFIMAFGIGANDVANAFATSVSAKSITLKQAVMIAAVCEFLGAMLLGASVTSTIRKSIIDGDLYADEPDVLMFGMLTALVSASFMMFVANYLALPVSNFVVVCVVVVVVALVLSFVLHCAIVLMRCYSI